LLAAAAPHIFAWEYLPFSIFLPQPEFFVKEKQENCKKL
jgi:hypothetical protein